MLDRALLLKVIVFLIYRGVGANTAVGDNCSMMTRRCLWQGQIRMPPFVGFVHTHHACSERRKTCLSGDTSINAEEKDIRPIKNIAIIGGGLAGLSAAYHLLDIAGNSGASASTPGMQITIYDKANVGKGGASAVAGGLIHPFSPRGKLILFGLPALECSNNLIQMAAKHEPDCILRDHLYRVALNDKNVNQLQNLPSLCPDLAKWMSMEEMNDKFGLQGSLGGVELSNGCKVVHVPTYLSGLLKECETKAKEMDGSVKWIKGSINKWGDIDSFNQQLAKCDAVILSAGAGLIHDQIISKEDCELPVQLIRGQSVEISLPKEDTTNENFDCNEAFLCGKCVAPLEPKNASTPRFVIGATHEYRSEPFGTSEVIEELKSRSYQMAKHFWDNGKVDNLTTGFRMQSNRGNLGRIPIIGRYNDATEGISHPNTWLFAGLSSRGLIYHGIFGRWLAEAILLDDEEHLESQFAEYNWWKKKNKS